MSMIVMLAHLLVTWSIGHSLAHSLNQSVTRSIIHPVFQHVILPVNLWVLVCIHPSYLVVWVGTLEFEISPISPTKNSEHKSSNFARPLWSGIGTKFWSVIAASFRVFCGWVFNWPISCPPFGAKFFFLGLQVDQVKPFVMCFSFWFPLSFGLQVCLGRECLSSQDFFQLVRGQKGGIFGLNQRGFMIFHGIGQDWMLQVLLSLSSSFIPRCWWCKWRVSEIHPFIQKRYRTLWSVASIQFWNFWPSGCVFFWGGSGGDHQSATSANCSPGVGSLADDRLF